MNYEKKLSQPQSRKNADDIILHVGGDAARLKILSKLVFGSDRLLQQRAVWPFADILVADPHLAKPYFAELLKLLEDRTLHEAVARNTIRIFQSADLPEKYQARLFDFCLAAIPSEKMAIAVRAFSITVATRLCWLHPELIAELKMILSELSQQPMAPAIQVRIKRALKDLHKAATKH